MKNMKIIFTTAIVVYFAFFAFTQGNIAINNDNSAPDASAMLDIKSTSQGLLIPRMTQDQRNAITLPANSLMIYQTDNNPGYYYNSGSTASPAWVKAGTDSGWSLTGNSGTSADINFIGTTDDVPLVFKVNNQLAGKIVSLLRNTSLGYWALLSNTTGSDNTAYGSDALYSNTEGSFNTANGYGALFSNTTANFNTAYGSKALFSNTTGTENTAT